MGIPPLKHIVESLILSEAGNVTRAIDLAVGTLNPDPYTNANNVRNGSIIRQLIVEIDAAVAAGTINEQSALDWYVWFNIAGSQTVVSPTLLNASTTKNQVFKQDGSLIEHTQSGGVWLHKWRLVIDIPRSYQQINDLDKIQFVYRWFGADSVHDLKYRFIYKEIFP